MLMIRLSRKGKKKQPTYRIIISEKHKDPWGDALEMLGFYNPRTKPATLSLKKDRIEYWLSKGAQSSATVHNLLVAHGVVQGPKRRVVKLKPKQKEGAPAQGATEQKPPEAKTEEKKEETKKEEAQKTA